MDTIRKEIAQFIRSKRKNQFCGRLIHWDVGASQDDFVILATEYYHAKYDLSSQDEQKPCSPPVSDPETTVRAVVAISKVIKLYDLGYGSSKPPSYLCGRLIRWDVGTFRENLVKLETDYCHPHYEPSQQIELKPYVPPARVPRASKKPMAERFYLRNGHSHKGSSKKPPVS